MLVIKSKMMATMAMLMLVLRMVLGSFFLVTVALLLMLLQLNSSKSVFTLPLSIFQGDHRPHPRHLRLHTVDHRVDGQQGDQGHPDPRHLGGRYKQVFQEEIVNIAKTSRSAPLMWARGRASSRRWWPAGLKGCTWLSNIQETSTKKKD